MIQSLIGGFRDDFRGRRQLPRFVFNAVLVLTATGFAFSALPAPAAVLFGLAALAGEAVLWRRESEGANRDAQTIRQGLANQLAHAGRSGSMFDSLSGLNSSWYLELRVAEEVERCNRYGASMALLVLRLTGFGLEMFSSDSWTKVQAELGRIAKEKVRLIDVTAVLGPLEFAVCLVECDDSGARTVGDRLTQAIGEHAALTGIAVFPDENLGAKGLVDLARSRAAPEPRTDGVEGIKAPV